MKNITVLVVEDEAIVAKDIENSLEQLGYRIAGLASTGPEAIDTARATRPDVVLMDIVLKGPMDGIAAAEAIRQEWGAPIIYLTAYADDPTLARVKATSPYGYVVKPFEARELNAVIQTALHRYHLDREVRKSRDWLVTLLNSLSEAVISTTEEGKVAYLNRAAESLTGWDQSQAQGQPAAEVVKLVAASTGQAISHPVVAALQGRAEVSFGLDSRLMDRGGGEHFVEGRTNPILHEDRLLGTVTVVHDVSGRKRAEEAVRQNESRYRLLAENITDVIWTFDMNLRCTYVSPSVLRLRGYTAEEAITQGLEQMLSPASYEAAIKTFAEEMDAEKQGSRDPGRSRVLELEVIRKDGSTVWVENKVSFLRDVEGRTVGIIGVGRNISERKRAEAALRESEERHRAILESAPFSIWMCDEAGTITFANRAALDLFGVSDPAQVVGRYNIFRDSTAAEEPLLAHFERAYAGEVVHYRQELDMATVKYETRQQGTVHIYSTVFPIPVSGGRRPHLVVMQEDVTVRVQMEQERAALHQVAQALISHLELKEILREIFPALMRLFQWDGATVSVLRADNTLQVHPFDSRGQAIIREGGLERQPLEQTATGYVLTTGQPLIRRDLPQEATFAFDQYSINMGRRSQVFIPLKAKHRVIGTLYIGSNQPNQYAEAEVQLLEQVATSLAVAIENARLHQESQQKSERLEAVRSVAEEITRELDLTILLELVSRRAIQLVGASSGAVYLWDEAAQRLIPRAWHGLGAWVKAMQYRLGEAVTGTVAERRKGMIVNDYRTSQYQSAPFVKHTQVTAVISEPLVYRDQLVGVITINDEQLAGRSFTQEDGDLLALFAAQATIAIENALLYEAVAEAARTDPLTGLSNRRRFETVLESEIARARRYQRPLSLVMVDVNGLKRVNDTFGHAGGDQVLRATAQVLREVARDSDLPVRWGGDEFVVLLPETDLAGAAVVAEKLIRAAGERAVDCGGQPMTLSISAGAAALTDAIQGAAGLLQAADMAMYQDKARRKQ